MKTRSDVTRKTLTAGCFLLVLAPRVAANNFSEDRPHSVYFFPANEVHLLPIYGTLGTGLETRYQFSDSFKLRLWHSVQDISESSTRPTYNYQLNLKILSNSVIADWHVFGGKFRTSMGMVFGRTELSANGFYSGSASYAGQTVTGSDVITAANGLNPSQTFSVGQWSITGAELTQLASTLDPNQTFTSGPLSANGSSLLRASAVVRYPGYAPYVGVGWGNNFNARKGGLLYSMDIGVMYLGRPKVDLSLSGSAADLVKQYYPAEVQAYLDGERQKIYDALGKYRYYPVVSVGMWYRF